MENIVNSLFSATLDGINAKTIEVEATLTKGLPSFSIVGLVSSDIQEARERTKSDFLQTHLNFQPKGVTIQIWRFRSGYKEVLGNTFLDFPMGNT